MTRVLSLAAILSLALSASCALAQSPSAPATGAAPPQSDPAATGSSAANPLVVAPAAAIERGPDKWMTPDVWSTFNGDLKAQKFSPATQITPDNVGRLVKTWETHTGDVSNGSGDKPASVWSATPLFVNNTLYFGTPFYRILALEPDTGKVKWTFDPHAILKALTQPDLKNRGVAYWQAAVPQDGEACEKMVYIGTMDAKLYGVDADTGKPCPRFGKNGMVDVDQWNTTNDKWPLSLLQPPTVYHDTLFLGWAGKDWTDTAAPPGTLLALDARTGSLKWTFDALPKSAVDTGTANVWASISIDPETGLLYVPVSSPSPNFYGGARKEKLPLATSVTALDSATGNVVWSRQLVHHDIWDYDTNSAAVLIDIKKDGKTIPALVQSSKQGFLFVLNRKTGEPIYPIEEKAAPKSDVPGEQAALTQPYVATPAPTVPDQWPGVSKVADLASLGYCSREAKKLRYDGRFTPPSLQGSLIFPPTTGVLNGAAARWTRRAELMSSTLHASCRSISSSNGRITTRTQGRPAISLRPDRPTVSN
jgi:quinoprotein glucose dehydrogenase